MLTMDQIHHIRALYYEQGYNISDIAKATGRDWKTVAKYIDMADFNEPLPIPASEKQFCPKLDPYKPLIDNWLEEDKKHPTFSGHSGSNKALNSGRVTPPERWNRLSHRRRDLWKRRNSTPPFSVRPGHMGKLLHMCAFGRQSAKLVPDTAQNQKIQTVLFPRSFPVN